MTTEIQAQQQKPVGVQLAVARRTADPKTNRPDNFLTPTVAAGGDKKSAGTAHQADIGLRQLLRVEASFLEIAVVADDMQCR